MRIQQLQFSHFRNIDRCDLEPSAELNLLTGENGSGKTAFLEALYYLGHARSFRTHNLRPLIQHQQKEFVLFCRFKSDQGHHQLGVSRGGEKQQIRLDGKTLNSTASLARTLPMLLITPESYRLLTEGPKHRRRLMDWTLFHVEHRYHESWKHYRRILLQRNAILRSGRDVDLHYWTGLLIQEAEKLQSYRSRYIDWLVPEFNAQLGQLLETEVKVKLYPGWNQDTGLADLFQSKSSEEHHVGYTLYGPHRAELRFTVNGRPAGQVLSRGQIKILIVCLLLAQSQVLYQRCGQHPLLLIDDLASELDTRNRERVMSAFMKLDCQLFVTATSADQIPSIERDTRMFHVEHGVWNKVI